MNSFHLSDINFLAVLTAWIIHIIMNLLWFLPGLFGNQWSRLTGKEMKPDNKWLIPGILGHLAMVFVLVILIKLTGSANGVNGLIIGLLTWIGFIVPLEIGEVVWEKIPVRLCLIRIGNQLLSIAVAGFILGAWQ
jgi:hypothetical protein